MKRNTTKDFIEKSILKHSDSYDYSLVEYRNSNTKVKIICREHGIFEQYPLNHTRGSGCSSCKGLKKLSTKDFIEKSLKIHNGLYNYSLVKLENNDSKIEIICKEHGIFLQRVSSHLRGNGCNKCKNDGRRTENYIFIEKSNLKHNNKYDYSLVEYKTTNTKIKIICPNHGVFEKTPKNHINGQGCRKCKYISEKDFIDECKLVHKNKYDYSLVVYKNTGHKITIICPNHGPFEQRAGDHMTGNGCNQCGNTSLIENQWLDSINVKQRQVRIGKYIVDGYDTLTNTIYEFNGDFWHGNPNIYNSLDINRVSKKTFGELYENTINKEKELISLGYNVISIWESEYKKDK